MKRLHTQRPSRKLKFALAALFCTGLQPAFAQTFDQSSNFGGTNPDIVTVPGGVQNVGIGDFNSFPNPPDKLTVGGDISLFPLNDADERRIIGRTYSGMLSLYSMSDENSGTALQLFATSQTDNPGMMRFTSPGFVSGSGPGTDAFVFRQWDQSKEMKTFVLTKGGLARIGEGSPMTSERLTVDGSIFLNDPTDGDNRNIFGRTVGGSVGLYSNDAINNGSGINLYGISRPGLGATIRFFGQGYQARGKVFDFAVYTGAGLTTRFAIDHDGVLHASNHLRFDLVPNTTPRSIMGYSANMKMGLFSGTDYFDGSSIDLNGQSQSSSPGAVVLTAHGNSSTSDAVTIRRYDVSSSSMKPLMNIQKDGKVIIGNLSSFTKPAGYMLYVESGILTERVRVAVKGTSIWPDYVFEPGYQLMPLSELDQYIQKNKHLPNIPSAEECVKGGLDVAEMDAMLLRKIEELTKYILAQQQALEQQKAEIDHLKTMVHN